MLKNKTLRKRQKSLPSKKIPRELHLYKFPIMEGLEDVSSKLNKYPAENIFGALFHAYALKSIKDDKSANEAERMMEYIVRAFENNRPAQVENYCHILGMLLKEYDDKYHIRTSKDVAPSEFLQALLVEDGIPQKSLVPECFPTTSQVSEFIHQKKGRDKLSYAQAVALGKKFNVDPVCFLTV